MRVGGQVCVGSNSQQNVTRQRWETPGRYVSCWAFPWLMSSLPVKTSPLNARPSIQKDNLTERSGNKGAGWSLIPA